MQKKNKKSIRKTTAKKKSKRVTKKRITKKQKNSFLPSLKKILNFLPAVLIVFGVLSVVGFYFFDSNTAVVVHSQQDTITPTTEVTGTQTTIVKQLRSESSYSVFPATSGQIIFHGDRLFPKVALTFDADMTGGMENMLSSGEVQSFYDSRLINILNATHTKATLFLTGMWIETYPKEAKQLAQNPLFELANHSYDHKGMDGDCYGLEPVNDDGDKNEVQKTQKLLEEIGIHNQYFRFPGGCYSQTDLDILSQLGMTAIQWDVAGVDGFNDDEANIESNVLDRVQNGSIIIMHMNGSPNEPKTADATWHIISELRQRGFEFVTVSELLHQ